MDNPDVVRNGLVEIALPPVGISSRVVDIGVFWGQFDNLAVVRDGLAELAIIVVGDASLVVGICTIARIVRRTAPRFWR